MTTDKQIRVELVFTGSKAKFEKALFEFDDNFDLLDSIVWELDYGTGESTHPTKYGAITIKQRKYQKGIDK